MAQAAQPIFWFIAGYFSVAASLNKLWIKSSSSNKLWLKLGLTAAKLPLK